MNEALSKFRPRCLDCDYLLFGLDSVKCPECGRAFDPNDLSTMNVGKRMGRFTRGSLKLPRMLNRTLLAAAVIILTMHGLRLIDVPILIWLSLLWSAVCLYWLVRFVLFCSVVCWFRPRSLRLGAALVSWMSAPIVTTIMIVLLRAGVPMLLAFSVSKPAMERLVMQTSQSSTDLPKSAWVGLFHANKIERIPGGIRFTANLAGGGFANCTSQPAHEGRNYYVPYDGNWYLWLILSGWS